MRQLVLAVALGLLMFPLGRALGEDADLPPFLRGRIAKEEYLRLRGEHVAMLRGLPHGLPYDPRARAERELDAAEMRQSAGRLARISSASWTPIGPAPIPNGQTYTDEAGTVPLQPVSGRVTAIAIHPGEPNTVYAGAADGGVYRSLDGGATWTALMDAAQSLSIGALAIDPSDPTRLWVGTGEANGCADCFYGVGLYRIRNADSAAPIVEGPFNRNASGADVFTFAAIAKILVHPGDPNTIFIAAAKGYTGLSGNHGDLPPFPPLGLYRSQNALGAEPAFIRLDVPMGSANVTVTDAVLEPGNPDHLLCVVAGSDAQSSGVWQATDANGASPSFTRTFPLPALTRAALAINKVASIVTVLLASGETAPAPPCETGDQGLLRRSTDGGATFGDPIPAADGFCGGQCFYDLVVTLDSNDANRLYLGGATSASGSCAIPSYARSLDGGATLKLDAVRLHPDTHAIEIAPSQPSTIYLGDDGGVFKSTDSGASWTSLSNATFNATQFESLALHPTDREFMIGGTQDNGTELRRADGSWTRADSGDGGYSLVDRGAVDTTTLNLYHTYFNRVGPHGPLGLARAATAVCATPQGWAFRGCGYLDSTPACDGVDLGAVNGISCDDSAVLFYAPIALGPGAPNTVYFGSDRLYRSANRGDTMVEVSQQFVVPSPTQNPVAVSAIAIGPSDDGIRLVGLKNGRVFLTTSGANPMIDVTGAIPPHFIGRIAIDPVDANVAYVTLVGYGLGAGGHVWKTANLLSEVPDWVASGNGIPDVPVNAFAIDPAHPQNLYAGSDIGVFASSDGGGSWLPFSRGLPRVPVFDMAIQDTNRVLRIATHGRGIWEITPPPVAAVCVPGALTLCINDAPGDARFEVKLRYETSQNGGLAGDGHAVALSTLGVTRGGLFYFADPTNPEMLVKILNGCNINQRFWVFHAAGTNLGFTLTVRDLKAGTTRSYTNQDLHSADPEQDTGAFACTASDIAIASASAPRIATGARCALPLPGDDFLDWMHEQSANAAPVGFLARGDSVDGGSVCIPDPRTLCIAGRFRARLSYETTQGGGLSGQATAIPLASLGVTRGGLFYFADATNPEMLFKVLDGCSINNRSWIFFSATTNVGFALIVEDTLTGLGKTYRNQDLTPAAPVNDTGAIACSSP